MALPRRSELKVAWKPAVVRIGALVGVVSIVLLCRPVARITPASSEKIQRGMRRAEVQAILGSRPGLHDGVGEWTYPDVCPPDRDSSKGHWLIAGHPSHESWVGLDGEVYITYVENGRVAQAVFCNIDVRRWSRWDFATERLLERWRW